MSEALNNVDKLVLESPLREESQGVSLMTIHGSKGLEFPVVLIADAGNKGRGVRNSELYFKDTEFGIVPNLRRDDRSRKDKLDNPYFERARLEETSRELAELKRLLYVAATRAEKKLLVFGKPTQNITEPTSFMDLINLASPDRSLFTAFVIPPLCEQERNQEVRSLRSTQPGMDSAHISRELSDYYASAPAEPRRERTRATTPSAIENAASSFVATKKPVQVRVLSTYPAESSIVEKKLENEFGTLCHFILERMIGGGALEMPSNLLRGLNPAQRDQVLSVAIELGTSFMNTDLGKLASSAGKCRTEFPFILAIPSANSKPWLVKGKMDLIFETAQTGSIPDQAEGRCVIVDFKTDREYNPSAHAAQLACYRSAAQAFSAFPVETWLFYLRDGITVKVMDEPDLAVLVPLAIATAHDT